MACEPLQPPPPLGPHDVRVDVHYAAFNFTDHLLVQGRYQEKPALPFVPGLDAAGVVSAVGDKVTAFQKGDRVVSSGVVGGWSTQLTAPDHRLVKVPHNLHLADAVGSINSHLTAYHGLVDRAAVAPGERVVVLGANGAVGKASVQIARHLGAQVFTVSREPDGSFLLGQNGGESNTAASANAFTVSAGELKDGLRRLLGKQGADVVVDPVGDHHTEAAVRNLAWRGRLLVIGFAAGDIPRIPTNLLLLKGAAILGVYCGGLLIQETKSFTAQLEQMFHIMSLGVLTPSPNEVLPAQDFPRIWERFSTAPRGTKVILGFS